MKIAIVQIHSHEYNDLHLLTLPNHAAYASKWGYDLLSYCRPFDIVAAHTDKALAKLIKMKDLDGEKSYDYLLYVGVDILFTNFNTPLISLIDSDLKPAVWMSKEDVGGSPLNNDMIIFRNTPFSWWFLNEIIRLAPEYVNKEWVTQQAVIDMLRDNPKVKEEGGIKLLNCRVLQSTPVSTYKMSAWQKGDYALHFLGMGKEDKMKRIKHFLDTGEVMWRQ